MKKLSLKMVALIAAMMMCVTVLGIREQVQVKPSESA
jgi:hypothetical protein